MSEWIEGSFETSITATQTAAGAVELWQNDEEPFHNRTIVDGFVTILTDTDDLVSIRLYGPVPNFAVAGDFSFSLPQRHAPENWYWFHAGRGPLVFRTRSKRTFGAQQELWAMPVKLRGTALTVINVGWQFLLQP